MFHSYIKISVVKISLSQIESCDFTFVIVLLNKFLQKTNLDL